LLTCCSAGILFSVLAEAELCAIPTIQTLLQGIVEIHLTYALSLQEEERPPQEQDPEPQPTNQGQVESQDEYGQFDLDWNDPTVLAALDSAAEPVAVPVPATTMQYTYPSLVEVRRSHVAQCLVLKIDHRYTNDSISKMRRHLPQSLRISSLHSRTKDGNIVDGPVAKMYHRSNLSLSTPLFSLPSSESARVY
jgi:hypothetical protein